MPNHATNGNEGLSSMEKIAHEIIKDLKEKYNISRVDYYVSALGNGIATSGIGKVFKESYKTQIIGIEPKECPTFYYTKRNEKRPENKEFTHKLYGTGSGNSGYDFPILNNYLNSIDEVRLVEEQEWINTTLQLQDFEGKFVGHTSAACFSEACKIAREKENKNKIIVIIFYDANWKYL
jgi:cysteine synthase A